MQNEDEFVRLNIWAAMAGRWQFAPGKVTYLGPHADRPTPPFGLVIAKPRMRSGKMLAKVRFGKNAQTSNGRIVIGYNAESRGYFSAGIGGYDFAYVLDEYIDTRGWRALAGAGNKDNIAPSSTFGLTISVRGQRVSLAIESIQVISHSLPKPLEGDQIGLFAWGTEQVEFLDAMVCTRPPEAFVVMQFGEPYDSLYSEVIKPVVQE